MTQDQLYLSRQQSRQVDQIAIEQFGMSGLVLMENAGRGCADTLCLLGVVGPVVICCGKGNNAGDGFVIARHLELRGHRARVLLWSSPQELPADAAANYAILSKSGAELWPAPLEDHGGWLAGQLQGAEWIVDALLGTGARGEPRAPLDEAIELMNAAAARRLAVDLPSGLDCDTGQASRHTFRADHTCTFVAAKQGFRAAAARPYVGRLHVVDIGAPRQVLEQVVGGR